MKSKICHFVLGIVTIFVVDSHAALSCRPLFMPPVQEVNASAIRSEIVMSKLLNEGVLNQLRTSNPRTAHVPFFADQIPTIISKLSIRLGEALIGLDAPDQKSKGRELIKKIELQRQTLKSEVTKIHNDLIREASQRLATETVTYEWYMTFFLRSIVYADVTLKLSEPNIRPQDFGYLSRRLHPVLGTSAVVSESFGDLILYGTLQKSRGSEGKYFINHLPENTLVPVLSVPTPRDIILAEKYGLSFVSLNFSRKAVLDGTSLYPMQFAAKQVQESLKQVNQFTNLIDNNKHKWIRNHEKIAARINGKDKLEKLYVYILRDAALQSELTKRFETGYRILFGFDVHNASKYLETFFKSHKTELDLISNLETREEFLKIIYQIEKEDLASRLQ